MSFVDGVDSACQTIAVDDRSAGGPFSAWAPHRHLWGVPPLAQLAVQVFIDPIGQNEATDATVFARRTRDGRELFDTQNPTSLPAPDGFAQERGQ